MGRIRSGWVDLTVGLVEDAFGAVAAFAAASASIADFASASAYAVAAAEFAVVCASEKLGSVVQVWLCSFEPIVSEPGFQDANLPFLPAMPEFLLHISLGPQRSHLRRSVARRKVGLGWVQENRKRKQRKHILRCLVAACGTAGAYRWLAIVGMGTFVDELIGEPAL